MSVLTGGELPPGDNRMRIVQVTDDLVLELWPAGEVTDRPVLRLRSLGAAEEGERQAVVIYPEEVHPLMDALVAAIAELTAPAGEDDEGSV